MSAISGDQESQKGSASTKSPRVIGQGQFRVTSEMPGRLYQAATEMSWKEPRRLTSTATGLQRKWQTMPGTASRRWCYLRSYQQRRKRSAGQNHNLPTIQNLEAEPAFWAVGEVK